MMAEGKKSPNCNENVNFWGFYNFEFLQLSSNISSLLVVKSWVWELLPTCNLHSVRTDALLAVMKNFIFYTKK